MKKTYIFLTISSLILIAVAIPLIFYKIPPNEYYGVRTHATLSNVNNWYKTNRLYGVCMVFCGAAFFAVNFAVGSWRKGGSDLVGIGLFMIQLFIPVIVSLLYSNYYFK
ncbi:SdpI family protein [Burkholderia thailandensis]|uniref:SdpI family protein n=1 Tax=Burkholderia TaxID=32008 RepID=UPI000B7ADC8A|nr:MULTISPECIES: SdpI family protein [Burkholderia]OXI73298.1 hypothetical protein CFB81_08235 [Burkholderia sp. AU28863]UJH72260.1 SdpI family protein [Burkholderia cenocepacia]